MRKQKTNHRKYARDPFAPTAPDVPSNRDIDLPVEPEPELRADWGDTLTPEELRACNLAEEKAEARPDISHLRPAIEGGWPAFKEGDRIVIERYATLLPGRPYLDTKVYRVVKVDLVTGKVNLFNEELAQHAMDNWRHGVRWGFVYKFLPEGGGPIDVAPKRRRGRPRKEEGPAPPPPPDGEKKRGRGRPKGSKNRPKAEREAEKAARREERMIKKAAKKSKT